MKLEAIGLNQDVVRWFHSYLADRQQLVEVSGRRSSSAVFPNGLFWDPVILIYVNAMSGVVNNKLLLYADDSAILVADKTYNKI